MTATAAQLRDRIIAHFQPGPPGALGVAVSGGSDSTALLTLLHDWQGAGGPKLRVVTVDHDLRPGSAAEAAQVAALCARLGLPHDTLLWDGWDGQGNLADRARTARYALMAQWAARHGLADVALGHTATDQAETFLMRLAREAGIDGLSAMAATRHIDGIAFHRPMLDMTREDLRAVLVGRGTGWIDDPSNEDRKSERVRARAALSQLGALGIGVAQLSRVAHHLSDTRDALYFHAGRAARDLARIEAGDIVIARAGLLELPSEVARRVVLEALGWVAGAGYGPRGRTMDGAMSAIARATDITLHGCHIVNRGAVCRITREYNAVAGLHAAPGEIWDGRWRVSGPQVPGLRVAALGEHGARACPNRHDSGLPAVSLWASPAVWDDQKLVAAPLAGMENGWSADLLRGEAAYFDAFLLH